MECGELVAYKAAKFEKNAGLLFTLTLTMLTFCSNTEAYIGPGMAVGTAALTLGLFIAFIMLVIGLVWYPIKRLRNAMRRDSLANQHSEADAQRRDSDK